MLEIENASFDIPYGTEQPWRRIVTLKNRGDQPVSILEVILTCSCVIPMMNEWNVATRSSTDLRLEMTSPDIGNQAVDVIVMMESTVRESNRLTLRLRGLQPFHEQNARTRPALRVTDRARKNALPEQADRAFSVSKWQERIVGVFLDRMSNTDG